MIITKPTKKATPSTKTVIIIDIFECRVSSSLTDLAVVHLVGMCKVNSSNG